MIEENVAEYNSEFPC